MGFPRPDYWSELSCPSPGGLSNPGIEPGSCVLQADSLPFEPPGKPPLHQQWDTNYGGNEENIILLTFLPVVTGQELWREGCNVISKFWIYWQRVPTNLPRNCARPLKTHPQDAHEPYIHFCPQLVSSESSSTGRGLASQVPSSKCLERAGGKVHKTYVCHT